MTPTRTPTGRTRNPAATASGVAELLWKPKPSEWIAVARAHASNAARCDGATRERFRRELGLPDRGRLALSGHQPGLWHAGIAAKRFAITAFAERAGWDAGWVVVDHDADDAGLLRVPVETEGTLDAAAARFAPDAPARPLGVRDATRSVDEIGSLAARAPAALAGRVRRAAELLLEHADAASLADQLASAAEDILAPLDPYPLTRTASLRIAGTELFARVVARAKQDPASCRASYNRAVAAAGTGAGVRALLPGELPFWVVREGTRTAWREDALETLATELAPRGLLMTGLLRHAACELFVHGFGGGGRGAQPGYDRVTEDWLADWLGWTALAPAVVASATLPLDLPGDPPPRASDIAAARWRAHHARHDPEMLGDQPATAEKRTLVDAIAGAGTRAERDELFTRLQTLLKSVRERHGPTIAAFDTKADELEAEHAAAGLRVDRTWSIALHDPARLAELRDTIRAAFGA